MSSFWLDQDSFRVRHDDGTEAAANWLSDINVDVKARAGWIFRSRFLIQEYGAKAGQFQPELRYSYNGGGYTLITTSSSYIKLIASGTVPDGTATTQQIGVADFDGGEFDSNGTTADELFTKSDEREYEWCHQIVPADVKPGDTLAIRVYKTGGVALDTYTNTLTITIRRKGYTVHTGQ